MLMAARIALIVTDPDGFPQLPEDADEDVNGTITARKLWRRIDPCEVGGYPAREYRDPDTGILIVIQKVAAVVGPGGVNGALCVVWAPATARDGENATFQRIAAAPIVAALVVKSWGTQLNADGSIRVPALNSDNTVLGTLAKSVWPTEWRVRLVTDDNGDPLADPPIPPAPPTGARCIGAVLA
jgi:hypothetical protein